LEANWRALIRSEAGLKRECVYLMCKYLALEAILCCNFQYASKNGVKGRSVLTSFLGWLLGYDESGLAKRSTKPKAKCGHWDGRVPTLPSGALEPDTSNEVTVTIFQTVVKLLRESQYYEDIPL
jgi:hypothetical protein